MPELPLIYNEPTHLMKASPMEFSLGPRGITTRNGRRGSYFQFKRRLWFALSHYIDGLTIRAVKEAVPDLKEWEDYTFRGTTCYYAEEALPRIPQAAEFWQWLSQPGNRPSIYDSRTWIYGSSS